MIFYLNVGLIKPSNNKIGKQKQFLHEKHMISCKKLKIILFIT